VWLRQIDNSIRRLDQQLKTMEMVLRLENVPLQRAWQL
jgi:hypothetical protein